VGHNEYLGILGVGSSLRMASWPRLTRAFLAARDWRLFQLMARVLARAGATREEPLTNASDTLMARVAGERSIPLHSELFSRGVEQFETNLGALLEKYRRAGVPVFIGTLVSNERDQMPLAVLSGAESDSAGAAKTAFFSAQDAEVLGDYNAARQGYAWARDLDPLRFRAPSLFNEAITRVAEAHGAALVDVHKTFVDASPHGLIGNGLILEHVHPNLDGYALLADAYFRSMISRGVPAQPKVVVPDPQAMLEMPVSDIDRWLGEYKVTRIKSAWPFTPNSNQSSLPPPRSEGERLAQEVFAQRMAWPEAQDALRQYYRSAGNKAEYTRGTTILADAFPFTPGIQFESAAALIDAGRPADALRYARRAIELEPRNVNNLLVSAHALLLSGRRDEGRAALDRVLQLDPRNPTAVKVLGELQSTTPAH
jgi:tetratricopeptide (TPR) repeat protein